MDKILVTLLFVVVAVVAIVGLEQWTNEHKNTMLNQSVNSINSVINE